MNPTFRIRKTFSSLSRAAFMPFFTVGDPDLETTGALVREAARRGADLVELGVPFSDPIADGPAIQASYHRALEKGFRVASVFELAKRLRAGGVVLPLVGMVSATLVFKQGLETFCRTAQAAGFDGLIVPDLPAGYEGAAAETAQAHGLELIFLCAPTTPPERRGLIAQRSSGFIYYVSVTGITGAREALPPDLEENVKDLKRRTATPVCVGFGIGRPEQAAAVARIADGVIVGSALVKRIARAHGKGLPREALAREIGGDLEALAQAVHGARQER